MSAVRMGYMVTRNCAGWKLHDTLVAAIEHAASVAANTAKFESYQGFDTDNKTAVVSRPVQVVVERLRWEGRGVIAGRRETSWVFEAVEQRWVGGELIAVGFSTLLPALLDCRALLAEVCAHRESAWRYAVILAKPVLANVDDVLTAVRARGISTVSPLLGEVLGDCREALADYAEVREDEAPEWHALAARATKTLDSVDRALAEARS